MTAPPTAHRTRAVSYADAAGRLGKAIGTPVKLVDVPRDAARADLLSAGLPSSQADALLMLFDGIRAGKATRQRKPSLTY